MMSNNNNRGGFWTPQTTWGSCRKSEYPRRPSSEGNKKDEFFHILHKVPIGDSPYVKAKHVQLIEKDPSRAISLFWKAINTGDRVDSALKDMAAVMKQLDRSDEAIEAVKSFRHLCPYDQQESIDNVLVELYKRSGRVEEEIELLESKLKKLEANLSSGGRKTKNARSQGKKGFITLEQERSRILGNLAWAYLQLDKYEISERYYRRALFLEPDRNKQCNLAICLMKMSRFMEAKSLLQNVKASCGNRPMDESYAKAYERAFQMLGELMTRKDNNESDTGRAVFAPFNKNSRSEASVNGGHDYFLHTQPKPSLRNSNEDPDRTSENWRKPIAFTGYTDLNKNLDSRKVHAEDYMVKSNPSSTKVPKKSWADMVEEDEEEFKDENFDYNELAWSLNQGQNQMAGFFDPRDDCNSTASSGNRSVRRSLRFDQQKETDNGNYYSTTSKMLPNIRRGNRLPVFHDITPFPDSP
ncbi:hypothetical protein ACFE04_029317 [Oxalis oulophora]